MVVAVPVTVVDSGAPLSTNSGLSPDCVPADDIKPNPPDAAALLDHIDCLSTDEIIVVVVVLKGCAFPEPNLKLPVTLQSEPTLNGCFTACVADEARMSLEPAGNGFTGEEITDDADDVTSLPTIKCIPTPVYGRE